MKLDKMSGATIAAAAAALLLSGSMAAPAFAADGGTVHCAGVNGCKGQSTCKTATNSCAGQNACKNQGRSELSAEECTKAGGTVQK